VWLRSQPDRPAAIRFDAPGSRNLFVSPDGRWLAMDDHGSLRIRPTNGEWRRLPGTEGFSDDVIWAEDSSAIGSSSGGRLRTIAPDGSNLTDLAPAPAFHGGTWRGGGKDGTILFADGKRLQTADVRTRKLTDQPLRFDGMSEPQRPVFLPEGDGFVFLVDQGKGRQLFRSSLGSTQMQPLVETTREVAFSRHPHNGKWHMFYRPTDPTSKVSSRILLAAPVDPRTGDLRGDPVTLLDTIGNPGSSKAGFWTSRNGMLAWGASSTSLTIWQLTWFDLEGNVLGRIGERAGLVAMALSPDESKVATLQGFPAPHIWIYDVRTGLGARLSNSPERESNAVWAADGKAIYYLHGTGATRQLARHSLEAGGGRENIAELGPDENLHFDAITPDGRYGLFLESSGVYRLDLHAPEPRKVERILACKSPRQLWVAPDGRSLFFLLPGGLHTISYPPKAGEAPRRLIATSRSGSWFFLSPDGRTLYFQSAARLFAYPLTNDGRLGERKFLFPLAQSTNTASRLSAATRDGKRILAIASDSVEEGLSAHVISDWTALIKGQ
jgi:hypothetical protein